MAVARNCGSLPRLGARHYFGFLCLSFLCGLSSAAVAQEKPQCNLPDCNEAKAFFQKFQQAVDSDQKPEVVAMIRYPLHSYRNGKATVFKTKTQLLASYDTVFAAGVRCAIKTATLDERLGKLARLHDQRRGYLVGPDHSQLSHQSSTFRSVEISIRGLRRESLSRNR